ncbi:MAG: Hsp20/alpha crystallin family protein [Dehalococcoidales bacterium]|jgi:HSP20 family protein|nr:Hsp20/alpha crystallin family protein [Dehalococcoidales bacterium]MDD5605261.1 Hsp20/alpha crystallin family protein [Dehalococcoidales bacterium]MDX9986875.1 Hsp20/alpha crystallin family protein [Dehalococcoidales bacterium]NLE90127.1 Hsp20/alpha crystallin family protein [Dehalococcoidales bacterium]
MADIIRWEPFRDMMTLRQAMDRLFEDSFVRPASFGSLSVPDVAIEMKETDSDIVIKAELPGVMPNDVDVSIAEGVLTVKGEHKEEKEEKETNYYRRELKYGSFSRSVNLPAVVNADQAEAVFENGILTLTLPKAEEAKPRQIKVKTTQAIEGKKK